MISYHHQTNMTLDPNVALRDICFPVLHSNNIEFNYSLKFERPEISRIPSLSSDKMFIPPSHRVCFVCAPLWAIVRKRLFCFVATLSEVYWPI